MNWVIHFNEERPHRSLIYIVHFGFIEAYNIQAIFTITRGKK